MTTLLIFRRDGEEMEIRARIEDGEWVYDPDELEPPQSGEFDELGLRRRYNGPVYFAVDETRFSSDLSNFEVETTRNGGHGHVMSDRVRRKIKFGRRYNNDELDKSNYPDELWERIKIWAEEHA